MRAIVLTNYQIIRTYTATDDCGNTISEEQVINVMDTTIPAINAADNMTIECGVAIPDPSFTVADNCDEKPKCRSYRCIC